MSSVWHCWLVLYTCPVLPPQETRQGTEASHCHSQTDHSPTSPRRSHLVAALITPSRRCVRGASCPPAPRAGPSRPTARGISAGKTCSVSKLCQGRSVSQSITSTSPAVDVWEVLVCDRQSRLMSKYSKARCDGSCEAGWVFYPLYIRQDASAFGAQSPLCLATSLCSSRNTGSCFLSRVPRPTSHSLVLCLA